MPSAKELAAGLRNQEATSPNSKVMFVGQEHGKKTALPDNVKKMVEKYGAYYEGAGGDKSDAIKYQGSWDDKASKEVKGYPKEFLYTLFTNSNVNNQKKNLTQPDKTIFDSALAAQDKWGYFKDRKFDADTLKQFLSASGMLDKSKQPATESNVKKFIDEGEGLMWPKNWEEYPNPAGKLAQKASEYRTNWLKSQKEGVYFVGSDHMKELNKPKANETAPSQLAKALARQDSVTQQPRNRFLGAIADAAGYVSDQADRYVVPERDPLFGGMRGGDLLPLRNVNRLLDDLSYGGRITTGRGQTTTLRPEVVDLAGVSGAMMPAAKGLSKAALREGARQIETGTGIIGRAALNPRMSAVPEGASMPQRPKTEFEILHDTAQRNAALPVEQGGLGLPANNTYIDRANAPGMFPTDVYHGANLPIEQIDPAMRGSSTGAKSAKQAFWTVDNPTVARGYAEYAANEAPIAKILKDAEFQGKVAQRTGNWDKYENLVTKAEELESANQANPLNGQNIMPLRINTNNSSVMDAGGNSFPYAENDINQFLRQSKYAGNDVAQIKNLDDAVGRVDLPANHYAVFNPANIRSRFAAFDPMRRHEADILAGVGVGGMLDPQAIAEALRQQDRK